MPFMQMYDEKGIAFHGGKLPGYPASHGCVRLPLKFAERLYGLTKIGTKVTIRASDGAVAAIASKPDPPPKLDDPM